MDVIREIEESLVAHWSHFGHWPRGSLVEEGGTLRYETPIPKLPYNGVIRTHIEADADTVVRSILGRFKERGVHAVWWDHPTASPTNLGEILEANGFFAAEHVAGMSLELASWEPRETPPGVRYVEAVDESTMRAYSEIIFEYWEVPPEIQPLVAEANAWAQGPFHRWVAFLGDEPIGKAMLTVAGAPGVAGIYGMSVRPEARGRGVAGALTQLAVQRAKELELDRVVLHATEMAKSVYARAGFVERCRLTAYADVPVWSDRH